LTFGSDKDSGTFDYFTEIAVGKSQFNLTLEQVLQKQGKF
jgi:hypothetical protein